MENIVSGASLRRTLYACWMQPGRSIISNHNERISAIEPSDSYNFMNNQFTLRRDLHLLRLNQEISLILEKLY